MNAEEQVAVLLKFALTIGPIAVYFLVLGLMNAQSRPQLLSGQADFCLLAVVFFPILLWLVMSLSQFPWVVPAAAAVVAAAVMHGLMPRRNSGWVIYNIAAGRFERALARAAENVGDRLSLDSADDRGRVWRLDRLGIRVRVSPFSLLRNVTCRFEPSTPRRDPIDAEILVPLRRALVDELESMATAPSASAAGFILIGTVMLSAPLMMMAHHMDEVVKVVRSLFA